LSFDIYAIASYVIPQPGLYYLQGSIAITTVSGCPQTGIDVVLLLNANIFRTYSAVFRQTFAVSMGDLAAGSVVRVAVGPGYSDSCDTFTMDFSLSAISNTSRLFTGSLGLLARIVSSETFSVDDTTTAINTAVSTAQSNVQLLYDLSAPSWRSVVSFPAVDNITTVCSGNLAWVPGRGCRRNGTAGGLFPRAFPIPPGGSYTQVRIRVMAYQQGNVNAFFNALPDGIGIFVGGSRIFTYAVGVHGVTCVANLASSCPQVGGTPPPAFVGTRFLCESGNPSCFVDATVFFPLRLFANAPPAIVTLANPTNLPVEVRLSIDELSTNEEIYFDFLEIAVR
jgi:hypothetical protein